MGPGVARTPSVAGGTTTETMDCAGSSMDSRSIGGPDCVNGGLG